MSADRKASSARAPILEPINVPKASDLLANKLRDLILSGKIPPGELLPTERELVQESGLSRSSVREALRVLEVERLITTKPGRSGGATVTLPGRSSVARSLQLFVKSHGIRLEALLECRLAVEPFLAARAAVNRTDEELAEISEIHARFAASMNNVASYKLLNLEWHLAITRASRNEVLIALMEAISQPIFDAAGYQEVTTPDLRKATIKAHAAILKAIDKQDADLAHSRMAKHLSAYSDVARRMLFKTTE